MSTFRDITGLRFGKLVVVARHGKNWPVAWQCKCDCGNELVTLSTSLIQGRVKSCGCYRKQLASKLFRVKHEIGKRQGILTVIGHRGNRKLCKCDCGRELEMSITNFIRSFSCGCAKIALQRIRQRDQAILNGRFLGVTQVGSRFRASFISKGKRIFIGAFDTGEKAAKAYDLKMIELYGDKAVLNFPPDQEEGEETFIGAVDVQPEDRWQ